MKQSVKLKLRAGAGDLLSVLGIEPTEEQQQAIETAKAQQARERACVRRWVIEHSELLNARMRAYREANREKVNALARARYDPEKQALRWKKYYPIRKAKRQANAEEVNAYERARYAKNSEKKLAACRAYREAHREEINARRRAAKAMRRAAQRAAEEAQKPQGDV